MKETLDKAEKLLCKAIDDVVEHGDLNAPYMDYLGKATDAIKDIYTIRAMMQPEEESEEKEFLRWKMQKATTDHERDMIRKRLEEL